MSQDRLSLALEGASDGLWDWDLVTNEVYLSPRWKGMLGYEDEELAGSFETWERLVHPEDLERAKVSIQDYLAGKSDQYEAEFRMLHKDGSERIILSRGGAIRDDTSGEYVRFVGTHVDLTERKRLEAALVQSKAQLQGFVDVTADLVSQVDAEGTLIFVNRAAERIFGLSPEECIGRPAFDFIHTDDRESTQTSFKGWIEDRVAHATFENRQESVDGRVTHMFWSINPRYDEEGGLVDVWSIARDITRRKLEEERSRTILQTSLDGFWLVDAGVGRLLQVNAAYCEMSGYTEAELLTMAISDLDAAESPEETVDRVRKIVTEGGDQFETVHRKRDGSLMDVEVSASFLDPYDGKIFVFLRDITEKKLATVLLEERAEALRRSNEELQNFAYGVSHDLQEPLRMVASSAQLLEDQYADSLDDAAREVIAQVADGAGRMESLINDLLDYSRVTSQGRRLQQADAQAALDEALKNLQGRIAAEEAVVTHDPLPSVLADQSQVTRLLQNLVGNAVKFRGEASPRVHVGVQKFGDDWVFSVADNGIGIEDQFQERVFEVFQRLHPRGRYKGTGIGLAICRRIVQRHGGRIWYESEVGKGTTFYFMLRAVE
jgi:PAS domain S-box-containing protein